jgi:YidC/Oxa1 family membrane protein insertase
MPRWATTLIVIVIAALLAVALMFNNKNTATTPPASTPAAAPAQSASATPAAAPVTPAAPIAGLHVVPVTEKQPQPILGSVEHDGKANPYKLEAELIAWGGGLVRVDMANYWLEVGSQVPYRVQGHLPTELGGRLYPMAAAALTINGQPVTSSLDGKPIAFPSTRWKVVSSDKTKAVFEITVADGADKPVVRVTRTWSLQPGRFDLRLDQHVENLTDQPVDVQLSLYGPVEMSKDIGAMDYRHVMVGYLQPRRTDTTKFVTTDGFDQTRDALFKSESPTVWPKSGDDPARDMAWVAVTNRYFEATLFGPVDPAANALTPLEANFPILDRVKWGEGADQKLALVLHSVTARLAPAGGAKAGVELPLVLYTGPRDPDVLKTDPVYSSLGLGQTIVYNLGGFCSFCTFAWLADFLLGFMRLIHSLLGDWGVAIILLVAIVRTLLHPLTKNSQINMMKVSKQMQAIQPEMNRIKEKYKDDSAKMNQEVMNLYREKGVNPAAMGLGCLPMFLQMPIWFALYAMLYFAIELRQSPAFWGVFQKISGGKWLFLADLSSADRFITFGRDVNLYFFTITSLNVIPLLMMVVFFVQQKYMQPPPTGPQTPEQKQQQMIMKFSVLMIPFFLYAAPSGLTLYILCSTFIGIIESRRVRSHLAELEASGKLFEVKPKKGGSFMDKLMKAASDRIEQKQKPGDEGLSGNVRRKPRQ